MKIKDALKRIVKTGELELGTNKTIEAIQENKAKMVITAENTPKEIEEKITRKTEENNIKHMHYPGTSLDLGETCKRPHPVTALAVKDSGKVNIQDIEGNND